MILESFRHYIKMAKPKRRASDSGDNDRQSKITKAPHAENTGLEQVPSECFQVEVKLRSTSKAERNDPKPPGYWEERHRALWALGASIERPDVTEEPASPETQPISLENDNIPNDNIPNDGEIAPV